MDRTIDFYHYPKGVATNVTSVVFSSANDTYGMRKVGLGNEIVVNAGVALTFVSTGHYRKVVTDLEEETEYEYGLKWVYNGDTLRKSHSFVTGSVAVDDLSYVTQDYMEIVRGVRNIKIWSNKGGTQTTTSVAAVDAARSAARVEIDGILMKRYPIPLTNASDTDLLRLQKWAERIASYLLYIGRGLQEDDPVGNQLRTEYKDTIEEVGRFGEPANLEVLDADEYEKVTPNAPRLVM